MNNIEKYTYEEAIKLVLMCGGDTDTNAKIVGNLFGAYYGDCVPEYMKTKVLNYDCTSHDNSFYIRPAKYGIKNAINLINQINFRDE